MYVCTMKCTFFILKQFCKVQTKEHVEHDFNTRLLS